MGKHKKPATLRNLFKCANVIGGQAFGIEPMVRDKRSVREVLNATLAFVGAAKSLEKNQAEPIARKHLITYLNQHSELENKSPEFENFIAETRKKIPHFNLKQINNALYHLEQFEYLHKH